MSEMSLEERVSKLEKTMEILQKRVEKLNHRSSLILGAVIINILLTVLSLI